MTKTSKTFLALAAAAALTWFACGAQGPVSPEMPNNATVPSATANAPSTNPVNTTPSGVTVQELENTFDPGTCTDLTKEPYKSLLELLLKVKLTNNSGGEVYSKAAMYHSVIAGCAATDEGLSGAAGNVSGDTNIANGQTGTVTYTFPITGELCGRYQLDDTWKPTNTFVIGKVINTGVDCPSCEAFKISLDIAGSGATRTVTAHFKAKSNKRLHVDFGDGSAADMADGESVNHTWDPGSFKVTATLESDGISCPKSYGVVVDQETTCRDLNVVLDSCAQAGSVHSQTVGNYYSMCLQGSWNQPPSSGSLDYGDSSSDSVGEPFTKVHDYAQTDSEQHFTAKLTVVRGNLSCNATLPIVVPPHKDNCDNYEAPTITGDISSDIKESTVVFDKGTVGPSGGSFNPTLPQTVSRPDYGESAGSFSTTYTLPYGPEQLECSVSKTFTKPVPPKDRTCQDVNADVSCSVSGSDANCTASWNNPGSGKIKLDSGSTESIDNGDSKDYSSLSLGNHTVKLQVKDGELTCKASDTFTIEQESCEIDHLAKAEDGCYADNPWGKGEKGKDICEYYGLSYLGKDDNLNGGSSYTLTQDARLAVAHWGGADCEGRGDQYYQFIQDALSGGTINSPGKGGISFVVYCGCPAHDDFR